MPGTDVRRVSRVELFFDLVAVAAVAQFIHQLQKQPGLPGVLALAGCYLAVWSIWFSVVLLVNVFGEGKCGLGGMAAGLAGVAVMAASVPRVVHGDGEIFSVAYLVSAFAVAGCWIRSRRADPHAHVHLRHLRERFGLFVLIVLGEAAVMLVAVASGEHWTAQGVGVAAGGAGIIAALAYVSLTTSGRRPRRMCNLPLLAASLLLSTAGTIALVSGVGMALADATRAAIPPYGRWLLGAGLLLVALAGLLRDLRVRRSVRDTSVALLPSALMAGAVAMAAVPPVLGVVATVVALGWRILWTHHRALGSHRAGRTALPVPAQAAEQEPERVLVGAGER